MVQKKKKTTKSKTVKSKAVSKKTTKKTVSRKQASEKSKRSIDSIMAPLPDDDNHSMLREALKDIARELNQLRDEKEELEVVLDKIASDLNSTQNTEVQLKDQLRKLTSVENALALKRGRLRKKLEGVKGKIQKVRDLSSKMESI